MIELVDEIWYSDFIIINQVILNSFRYLEIIPELDGSEVHQLEAMKASKKGKKIWSRK